jgi:hypothetical protein
MAAARMGRAKRREKMRRNLMLVLALSAALAVGAAAIANATQITLRAGNMIITFGGNVVPSKLPKNKYVPVSSNYFGKIKTSDGTHPSALREVIFDVDKDVKINAKGFPACKPSQLTARDTKAAMKVCGKAKIGAGVAHIEIAFPEQNPILVKSPITIFNGGQQGGKTKLLIHVFITVPVPAAIVTQVTITKKGAGIHTVSKVPVAAGGSGSAIDFKFTVGKSYTQKGKKVGYTEAKCPDGVFKANVKKVLFKNEARIPGVAPQTVLKGKLAVPCKPKG